MGAALLAGLPGPAAFAGGLSIPASQVARGFPMRYPVNAGIYVSGPYGVITVADLDGDGKLEILMSAPASGRVLAYHSDGTPATGWPAAAEYNSFGYFAVADLRPATPGPEVFMSHFANNSPSLQLFSSTGQQLSGWPLSVFNYSSMAPAIRDLDHDGVPEIFVEEEDWQLHGYSPSGQPLSGWPVGSLRSPGGCASSQRSFTPTFIDLDRDGRLDVVYANGGGGAASQPAPCVEAYDIDGRALPGFPRLLPGIGFSQTFFNVADVDGDGKDDLVTIQGNPLGDDQGPGAVQVLGSDGVPKQTLSLASSHIDEGVTAIGDLDGDGVPDIVALAAGTVSAFTGQGRRLPGWPIRYFADHFPNPDSTARLNECGLAIGDVDGDLQPDVVFCVSVPGQWTHTYLFALDRHGVLLPGFPYLFNEDGSTGRGPVIADIDGDGHNEIIVAEGNRLWVLSLDRTRPHGRVEWQQTSSDSANTGRYAPSFPSAARSVDFSLAATALPVQAGAAANLQFVVAKLDAGPGTASLTVRLPGAARGRAPIPAGCAAFQDEITCAVDGFSGPAQRTISIPLCIDTAGTYTVTANIRASGPESNYGDNRASAQVTVSAGSGAVCPMQSVPDTHAFATLSAVPRVYTESPIYLYWRSFNTTRCAVVYPDTGRFETTSIGYDFHDSGTTAGRRHLELQCASPYGDVSSAVDVDVVDATLTLSSSAAQAPVGTAVTLTWNSQDMDSCEAAGTWSGVRALSGSEQITVLSGAQMYEIRCMGALGQAYRRISVEGKDATQTPPPPPPPSQGSGGGGGALDPALLEVLGLLVAMFRVAPRRRLRVVRQ